jgi:hypothetical protein
MKKILMLLFLIFLHRNEAYGQLLTNPSLTIKDLEVALKNTDHLRGILLEHNFKFQRYTDYEECIRADGWESEILSKGRASDGYLTSSPMLSFVIYEYKPNLGPRPDVTVSISTQVYKDPNIVDKLEMLLESIRIYYPERSVGSKEGTPFLIYRKKGSKIEIEVMVINRETTNIPYDLYLINFNLLK